MSQVHKKNNIDNSEGPIYIGIAEINVLPSMFGEGSQMSQDIGEGLRQPYRKYGHGNYTASNYVPVLIDGNELNAISETSKKPLSIHTQYSDGEVYCNVRRSQKSKHITETAAWKARLTNCKRIGLNQLLKRPDLTEHLDHLISIPGLWVGLELGNIQKHLALRCDEEIKRYLRHIRTVWETMTMSNKDIQMMTDIDTVRLLQLRVPSLSRVDQSFIQGAMASGMLFPRIVDPKWREEILGAILSVDCLIPSLKTMHENLKYLEVGAKILKTILISSNPRLTIHNALRSAWTCNGNVFFENSEGREYLKKGYSDEFLWDIVYKQVWIWALRNFAELGGRAPLKEPRQSSYQTKSNSVLQYKFAQFAKYLGINTEKIASSLEVDPRHMTLLGSICQIYPSRAEEENESLTASFLEKLPTLNQGNNFVDNHHKDRHSVRRVMDLNRRWGVPFVNNYIIRKEEFYLSNISRIASRMKGDMPTDLLILNDFISSFFGETSSFAFGEAEVFEKQSASNKSDARIDTDYSNANTPAPVAPFIPIKSSIYPSPHERHTSTILNAHPLRPSVLPLPKNSHTLFTKHSSATSNAHIDSSLLNMAVSETMKDSSWRTLASSSDSETHVHDDSLLNEELLAYLQDIRGTRDSNQNDQEVESQYDTAGKQPNTEALSKANVSQNNLGQEKGTGKKKEVSRIQSLIRTSEEIQNHRLAVASIISNESSSDRDSMYWPKTTTVSALPKEISPPVSERNIIQNQLLYPPDTSNRYTTDMPALPFERSRSPVLSMPSLEVPPNRSNDYESETFDQKATTMQTKLIESIPAIGEASDWSRLSEQETVSLVHQKAISDREWSPEELYRSPIISMAFASPAGDALADYMEVDRPNLIPSGEAPINISNSMPLFQPDNQMVPIARTVLDSQDTIVRYANNTHENESNIIEDQNMIDASSFNSIELPEEPRRSLPFPFPENLQPPIICNNVTDNINLNFVVSPDLPVSSDLELAPEHERSPTFTIRSSPFFQPQKITKRSNIVSFPFQPQQITDHSNDNPIHSEPGVLIKEYTGKTHLLKKLRIQDIESYLNKRTGWMIGTMTNNISFKTIPAKKLLEHIHASIGNSETSHEVYYFFKRQDYNRMQRQAQGNQQAEVLEIEEIREQGVEEVKIEDIEKKGKERGKVEKKDQHRENEEEETEEPRAGNPDILALPPAAIEFQTTQMTSNTAFNKRDPEDTRERVQRRIQLHKDNKEQIKGQLREIKQQHGEEISRERREWHDFLGRNTRKRKRSPPDSTMPGEKKPKQKSVSPEPTNPESKLPELASADGVNSGGPRGSSALFSIED